MTFVIVRQREPYRFNKFHEKHEEAIQEACRLSKAENDTFMVLKVVGVAEQQPIHTVYIPAGQ